MNRCDDRNIPALDSWIERNQYVLRWCSKRGSRDISFSVCEATLQKRSGQARKRTTMFRKKQANPSKDRRFHRGNCKTRWWKFRRVHSAGSSPHPTTLDRDESVKWSMQSEALERQFRS